VKGRIAQYQVEALLQVDRSFTTLLKSAGTSIGSPESSRRPGRVITREDIGDQTVSRVEELFVGRFPGVQVFSAPGGIVIRIRGASTVNGSGDPLYIVDGMAFEPGHDASVEALRLPRLGEVCGSHFRRAHVVVNAAWWWC
jgi:hypothetical protein